jgi:hypothetical protein
MSVRYLWIDAVCVIQGPDGDFQQEAARMEDVYANALFTIASAASKDTTQPFLVPRDPLWWTDCHLVDGDIGERGAHETHIEGNTYCGASRLYSVASSLTLEVGISRSSFSRQDQYTLAAGVFTGNTVNRSYVSVVKTWKLNITQLVLEGLVSTEKNRKWLDSNRSDAVQTV